MLGHIVAFLVFLARMILAYLKVIFHVFVPPSKVSIRGKVVLITGSGGGLGRQMALGLAEEGARLVLWDISADGNKQTASVILAAIPDAEVHLYTVDITDKDLLKTSALRVRSEVGQVYMLVNNAGVLVGETLLDLTEDDIQRTININLLSAFWMVRAFLPAMLDLNCGHVVTTCSLGAVSPMHRLTDYCASKAGLHALDEALEMELRDVYGKTGVKQTLVCPYFLDTGLIHSVEARGSVMQKASKAAEEIVDGILRQKRFIFYPKVFMFSSTLKGLLPHEASLALFEFLQIKIPSQNITRPHED